MVKERLGVRTALGVSNISFGLPQRNMVNVDVSGRCVRVRGWICLF